MKAHKRISETRKQSRIDTPKQNLWFYKEAISTNQPTVTDTKFIRNDRISLSNEDFKRYEQVNSKPSRIRNECSFVVDWQLEDVF